MGIKYLLARKWEVTLTHTYREGNMCADWLAKKGAMGNKSLIYWDYPPFGIDNILVADTMGLDFCKN